MNRTFIRRETILDVDRKTSTTVVKRGAPPPLNEELIRDSVRFKKYLVAAISSDSGSAKTFWLEEIVTPALKMYNAAADANDIAASVLETDPRIAPLRESAQAFLATGLRIKLLRRVASDLKLDAEDSALLVSLCLQPPKEADPFKELIKMINTKPPTPRKSPTLKKD
jgi:hypothetical protein